nr:hypothetical protein [uncultured bacterium]
MRQPVYRALYKRLRSLLERLEPEAHRMHPVQSGTPTTVQANSPLRINTLLLRSRQRTISAPSADPILQPTIR